MPSLITPTFSLDDIRALSPLVRPALEWFSFWNHQALDAAFALNEFHAQLESALLDCV